MPYCAYFSRTSFSTYSTLAARHSSPSFSAKFTLPHWLKTGFSTQGSTPISLAKSSATRS
jgi:hypothetical protein